MQPTKTWYILLLITPICLQTSSLDTCTRVFTFTQVFTCHALLFEESSFTVHVSYDTFLYFGCCFIGLQAVSTCVVHCNRATILCYLCLSLPCYSLGIHQCYMHCGNTIHQNLLVPCIAVQCLLHVASHNRSFVIIFLLLYSVHDAG